MNFKRFVSPRQKFPEVETPTSFEPLELHFRVIYGFQSILG